MKNRLMYLLCGAGAVTAGVSVAGLTLFVGLVTDSLVPLFVTMVLTGAALGAVYVFDR